MNTLDDVWAKVDQSAGPDECWPWTAGRFPSGYGVWTYQSRSVRAHRAAWMATNGAIPGGLMVLHRCDNPPCCNPKHLFLGTAADNNDDAKAKGRAKEHTHGAEHGTYSGYIKHVTERAGWTKPACQPCREANTAHQKQYQARQQENYDGQSETSLADGPPTLPESTIGAARSAR